MRAGLAIGMLALALAGCSPPAHIAVTVRSPSDISFKVSTTKDDPACIDAITIHDAGGVLRWAIQRQSGEDICLQEISFPTIPSGFAAEQGGTTLAKGSYQVFARSGIYAGVEDFEVN